MACQLGEKVEVRLWFTDIPPGTPDGMEGNYRTWTSPWLPGTVLGFDEDGNHWVSFVHPDGYTDHRYFGDRNVRHCEQVND